MYMYVDIAAICFWLEYRLAVKSWYMLPTSFLCLGTYSVPYPMALRLYPYNLAGGISLTHTS